MELYGQTGSILVPARDVLTIRLGDGAVRQDVVPAAGGAEVDQVGDLAAVVRGAAVPTGMSSVALNMVVTEILDAARESARTGRTVNLPAAPPW